MLYVNPANTYDLFNCSVNVSITVCIAVCFFLHVK